jgi:hypothetical protein
MKCTTAEMAACAADLLTSSTLHGHGRLDKDPTANSQYHELPGFVSSQGGAVAFAEESGAGGGRTAIHLDLP